jgi:predicted phosphodiesterase
MPSKLQGKMWGMWEEFWDEWVPMVCRGEPFAVVVNGDTTDGVHHNSVTQITHNLTVQARIAEEVLKPVVEKCEGRFYMVRGTEAHVGSSGMAEEQLAKTLGAIPDDKGNYARWELWIEVGEGLVHVMHHIGTSGSLAYETTAVQKELEQSFVEAARWGTRPPDVIVRGHRHRNVETRIRAARGFATAFTLGCWQLKPPLAYRIAGGRMTQPQIGGSLVRYGNEDMYTRHKIWDVERPKTEVINASAD